jgi:hypothetical protein
MDVVCSPKTAIEMDRSKLKYYTDTEIRQLYYCKSYLNVQRISNLCTADGVFILPSISKGERSITMCIQASRHTTRKTRKKYMDNLDKISKHDMQKRQ